MASIRVRQWKNGDGSRMRAFVVDYRDQFGKRRSKQFKITNYASEREAREAARAFRDAVVREVRQGTHTPASQSITVAAACRDFIEARSRGSDGRVAARAATIEEYRRQIKLWVVPRLGATKLSDLTAPDLANYRQWLLTESGAGRRTAQVAFQRLKSTLNHALVTGRIAHNFWSGISISVTDSGQGGEVAIPTREEMKWLLRTAKSLRDDPVAACKWEAAPAPWRRYHESRGPRGWDKIQSAWRRYYPLVLTAALTGMRQGELRGLQWPDVAMAKGLITVRRAVDRFGVSKSPKSRAGRREIEIPDDVRNVLQEWKIACPPGDLVFPNSQGNVLSRNKIQRYCWSVLLDKAELRGYTFHALRHYFASMQIALGANPKEVMQVMGHADVQTTFNVYGHLFPEDRGSRRARAQRIAEMTT